MTQELPICVTCYGELWLEQPPSIYDRNGSTYLKEVRCVKCKLPTWSGITVKRDDLERRLREPLPE